MTQSTEMQTAYYAIQNVNNFRRMVNFNFQKGDFKRAREIYKETERYFRDVSAYCRQFGFIPSVKYDEQFTEALIS